VVVEPADEIPIQLPAVRQTLHQSQFLLLRRDGDMPVGKVDKVHRRTCRYQLGIGAHRPFGVGGRLVGPVGQGAVQSRVGLLADEAGAPAIVAIDGDVGPQAVDQLMHSRRQFLDGLRREQPVFPVDRVRHVDAGGQGKAIAVAEAPLASLAVAEPMVDSGIVPGLETTHIEENAVYLVMRQQLLDDLQGIALLIVAQQTGMHIAVIVDDVVRRGAKSPLGVRLIERAAHLGKVGPRQQANVRGVAGGNDALQAVPLEKGALEMVRVRRRIAGDDPRAVKEHVGGLERPQIGHKTVCVDIDHVNLTQIRLDHAPGPIIPPVCHPAPPVCCLSGPRKPISRCSGRQEGAALHTRDARIGHGKAQ